jgi:hypothetical protein
MFYGKQRDIVLIRERESSIGRWQVPSERTLGPHTGLVAAWDNSALRMTGCFSFVCLFAKRLAVNLA